MPQSPDQDHMGSGFRSPTDPINRSLYADLSPEVDMDYINHMPLPAGVYLARHGQAARPSATQGHIFSSIATRNERMNPQSDANNV